MYYNRNKMYSICIGLALILLIFSCSVEKSSENDASKARLNEVSKLAALSEKRNLSAEDFAKIEELAEGSEEVEHELEEIMLLVKYNEHAHAKHGLSFLEGYLIAEKELLCPPHALAHYYVFIKHGEEHYAQEAFEEIEEQLNEWIETGKALYRDTPDSETFENIIAKVKWHIQSVESGNIFVPEKEIYYLANEASFFCFEEE